MADMNVLWAELHLEPYEKEKHAQLVFKFLYWEESVSGGPIIVAGGNVYNHDNLAYIARDEGVVAGDKKPAGAGVYLHPNVVWYSRTLDVTMPEKLRPIILEALGIS